MGLRPFAECGAKGAAQLFRSTHWCSMLCDMQDHPASVLEPGPAALHVSPAALQPAEDTADMVGSGGRGPERR